MNNKYRIVAPEDNELEKFSVHQVKVISSSCPDVQNQECVVINTSIDEPHQHDGMFEGTFKECVDYIKKRTQFNKLQLT